MTGGVKECIVRRTWSSDHGVTVEARQTEFTLRSSSVISTYTLASHSVTISWIMVITETASTRRKRSAVRWIPCIPVSTLLAELTLLCTSFIILFIKNNKGLEEPLTGC